MPRRTPRRAGRDAAAHAILELLARRAPGATVCPSEVARHLYPTGWRARMDEIRSAAAELVAEGRVQILQRGAPVSGPTRGPIRIGRPTAKPDVPQASRSPLVTPDGRYVVVRGRLWRAANPHLPSAVRQRWVDALMEARRDVAGAKRSGDPEAMAQARLRVNEAKVALGERGPVWWKDGAPDEGRRMAKNTRYASWYAAVTADLATDDGGTVRPARVRRNQP